MFKIEIDQQQMGELRAKLKQAPDEFKSGLLKRIFEKAMQRVMYRMIAETPQSKNGVVSRKYSSRTHAPGYLKRSIEVISGGTDYPTVWVRPQQKHGGFDAWYWYLPMMRHLIGNSGKSTSKTTDYVKTAWNATKGSVESEVKSEIESALNRIFA